MSANLRAFLALIRWCEGTAGEDGYRTRFGGGLFDSFSDHPGGTVTRTLGGKPITSSAAGAYQFLQSTWDECRDALGLPDFSPESQDKAAIFLIKRRGALEDVEAGRIEAAIAKCAKEWASFPGSPYSQPTKTLAQCIDVYQKAGGFLVSEFQPASLKDIVTGKEPAMPAPFIGLALEALLSSVPSLIRHFGKGTRSEDNAKLAEVIVPLAKDAIGAANEQELVERVMNDPAALQKVDTAIRENWLDITEAGGGGIEGARAANIAASAVPLWKNPAFAISVLIIPLVYYAAWAVLSDPTANAEIKTMVVSLIVGGALGSIMGFFLGSSFTTSSTRGLGAGK